MSRLSVGDGRGLSPTPILSPPTRRSCLGSDSSDLDSPLEDFELESSSPCLFLSPPGLPIAHSQHCHSVRMGLLAVHRVALSGQLEATVPRPCSVSGC